MARIRYGHGRVAFEANRDAVLEGLMALKPVTMIYEEMKDELGMPYRTFARHVQKLRNTNPPAARKGVHHVRPAEQPRRVAVGDTGRRDYVHQKSPTQEWFDTFVHGPKK